jgi:hypothetical protein
MNRLAIGVAQTAVAATVSVAPAQATASPLTGIAAGAGLDADIAAPPLPVTAANDSRIHDTNGSVPMPMRVRHRQEQSGIGCRPVTGSRGRKPSMRIAKYIWLGLLASIAAMSAASMPAAAQQQQKPNILFIMGDDIGIMQPSIYHRGLMVGETPNIDRIGNEGAIFMHYYAEQSCTAGRNAFFTGMHPLRTGMIPPQLPGSPSYLRPGTPAVAWFLRDLGYNTGEFGKNHLGDHTDALPTAHGFHEFWGYLYHLDAMQGVSFPDINRSPTQQTVAPPCRNTPIPGLPEVPGAVDPATAICLTPPRPVLWCRSSDGTSANQTCQDQGPLTLERSKTVDEEISAKVVDFLDRNDPRRTNKPFFVWYNPARMHHDRAARQIPGHGG